MKKRARFSLMSFLLIVGMLLMLLSVLREPILEYLTPSAIERLESYRDRGSAEFNFRIYKDGFIHMAPTKVDDPEGQMTSLRLSGQDTDVSVLVDLPNLRNLWLGQGIDNGAFGMLRCSKLEQITIDSERIDEKGLLSAVPNVFDNVRILYLRSKAVDDATLAGLRRFPNLRNLELTGECRIRGPGLKHLPKSVRCLEIPSLLEEPKYAVHLANVEQLYIRDADVRPGQLRQLARLTNLVELNLADSRIPENEIGGLSAVRTLTWLNLHGVNLAPNDLRPLGEMPKLETLFLRNIDFKSATFLESFHEPHFPSLRQLELGAQPNVRRWDVMALKRQRPNLTVSVEYAD